MVSRLIAALAIAVSLAGFSHAEDVAVLIDNSKPGTYLLTVDALGVVTAVPLKVVRVGKPSIIKPPTTELTFEQAVQQMTQQALDSGGTKATGSALSSVYSRVSASVSDGTIAPDKAFESIKEASDAVLKIQADAGKWATFRIELGKALTALATDGVLSTKAQVAAALQRIAGGMNAATS